MTNIFEEISQKMQKDKAYRDEIALMLFLKDRVLIIHHPEGRTEFKIKCDCKCECGKITEKNKEF